MVATAARMGGGSVTSDSSAIGKRDDLICYKCGGPDHLARGAGVEVAWGARVGKHREG